MNEFIGILLQLHSWNNAFNISAIQLPSEFSSADCFTPNSSTALLFHANSKSHCDWRSVSKSWYWGSWSDIYYCLTVTVLFFVGRPLWLEDGSVICTCCWPLPAQSFLGPSHLGTRPSKSSQSHIASDGQSVSKSWCRATFGAYDQIFSTVWQLRSFLWGALSDERAGLSFVRVIACISKSFVIM
jgi:hypothetical protein